MPTATRATVKRDPDAAGANATATGRQGDDCAICLMPIDAASEVKLVCGHRFHGQCAARALQLDRRCPYCRKKPRSHVDDEADLDEEADYDRMIDASEEVVIGRLVKKVQPSNLRAVLRDFGVADAAAAADKQELAELVSEQLHYETDPDGDDESDDDDDD
jgi:hypothetical protein